MVFNRYIRGKCLEITCKSSSLCSIVNLQVHSVHFTLITAVAFPRIDIFRGADHVVADIIIQKVDKIIRHVWKKLHILIFRC